MITQLNQVTWVVRNLNTQHLNVLNRFKLAQPDMEFPALHKELFSVEGQDNSWVFMTLDLFFPVGR